MIIQTKQVQLTTYRSEQFNKFREKFGASGIVYDVIYEIDQDIQNEIDSADFIVTTHSNCDFDIVATGCEDTQVAIDQIDQIIHNLVSDYLDEEE